MPVPSTGSIEKKTIGHVFPRRLHVGIENEMSGYELVLLQKWGTSWRYCDIGYNKRVLKSAGNTPVNNLPLAQIRVEGAADHKKGTPEHITGPLRISTPSFDVTRECLELLMKCFKFWVMEKPFAMPPFSIEHDKNVYVFLENIIKMYNDQLKIMGSWDKEKHYELYKLKLDQPFYAHWAVTRRAGKAAAKLNTQANIEVPFRSIGQPSGDTDLAKFFGSGNKKVFLKCRELAQGMVQDVFAAERLKVTGKTGPVKLEKLNSLFTLYYFAVCMHVANSGHQKIQAALKGHGQSAEDRSEGAATADKSRWELLPKVQWKDLIEDGLSLYDRKVLLPLVESTVKWNALKVRMNQDLLNPGLGLNVASASLSGFHDSIIKTQAAALSSTGKPLPVERYAANKIVEYKQTDASGKVTVTQEVVEKTEPVIVFEFRQDVQMGKLGKPGGELSKELVNELDALQSYALREPLQ